MDLKNPLIPLKSSYIALFIQDYAIFCFTLHKIDIISM